MKYLSARLKREGVGGFLCPPTHPEHAMSEAARVLAEWVPLPVETPDVQKWIHQVLGYFKGCY